MSVSGKDPFSVLSALITQTPSTVNSAPKAANIATIRQGSKDFWKDYCSHQADLAALESVLPGVTRGDYVPTVNKTSREVGAHVALEEAASSTALKYAVRAKTGVPMSVTSKFLGYLGTGLLLFSGYEATKAAQEEYQSCTAREGVNTPDIPVVRALP